MKDKEIKKMHGLFSIEYFPFLIYKHSICAPFLHIVAFFQEADDICPSIEVSNAIFLKTNCYFIENSFSIFITWKKQDQPSHLNISVLIEKKPIEM